MTDKNRFLRSVPVVDVTEDHWRGHVAGAPITYPEGTVLIGIDPGKNGSLAALNHDGRRIIEFRDQPLIQSGKTGDLDLGTMAEQLRHWEPEKTQVALERVNPMPARRRPGPPCPKCKRPFTTTSMGASSAFSFGGVFYAWRAILTTLGLPFRLVTPQRWKKLIMDGCPRSDTDSGRKEVSRQRALELWPASREQMKLKKHHARAEAALIAASLLRV